MSKRIFTTEEMAILAKNANVKKVSERSITYAKEFKLKAVERYKDGLPPSFIFLEAGFNLLVVGRETPNGSLKRWRKTDRRKGKEGFESSARGRGRPKKAVDATDADKIRRLEMENAYLKAENDFLAQLRAKRAERYSSQNKGTPLSKN
jgi:transposase-like protein